MGRLRDAVDAGIDLTASSSGWERRCGVGQIFDTPEAHGFDQDDLDWLSEQMNEETKTMPMAKVSATLWDAAGVSVSRQALAAHAGGYCICRKRRD